MARNDKLVRHYHSIWRYAQTLGYPVLVDDVRIPPERLRRKFLEAMLRKLTVSRKRMVIWRVLLNGLPDPSFENQGVAILVDDDVKGHYFPEGIIAQDAEHYIVACDQATGFMAKKFSDGPVYFRLGGSIPHPLPWNSTPLVQAADGKVSRWVPVRMVGRGNEVVQATRFGMHKAEVQLKPLGDFVVDGDVRLERVTAEAKETFAQLHSVKTVFFLGADETTTWLVYEKASGMSKKLVCAAWTHGVDGTMAHPEHVIENMRSLPLSFSGPTDQCLVLGLDSSDTPTVLRIDRAGVPDSTFGDQGRVSLAWAEQRIAAQTGTYPKKFVCTTLTYSESEGAYFLYFVALDSANALFSVGIVAIDQDGKILTKFGDGGVLTLSPEAVGLALEPSGEGEEFEQGLSTALLLVSIQSICVSVDSIYLLNVFRSQVYRVDRRDYDVQSFELAQPSNTEYAFPLSMIIDRKGRLVIGGECLRRYLTKFYKIF